LLGSGEKSMAKKTKHKIKVYKEEAQISFNELLKESIEAYDLSQAKSISAFYRDFPEHLDTAIVVHRKGNTFFFLKEVLFPETKRFKSKCLKCGIDVEATVEYRLCYSCRDFCNNFGLSSRGDLGKEIDL